MLLGKTHDFCPVFQVLCNGYGSCQCGTCVCNSSTVYRGKYCDECPVSILDYQGDKLCVPYMIVSFENSMRMLGGTSWFICCENLVFLFQDRHLLYGSTFLIVKISTYSFSLYSSSFVVFLCYTKLCNCYIL